MTVLVIVPMGTLSRRPRAYKLCKYLNEKGHDITHWGWDRDCAQESEKFLFPIKKRILLKGGGYSNKWNKFMYMFWMLKVFYCSFFINKKTVVWAIGFESAFPVLLAARLKGLKVVFDDADRFSMVFNFPLPLKRVVEFFERVCSRCSNVHVIPNKKRYDFESTSFLEVKNMPADADVLSARNAAEPYTSETDGITLYITGLLEDMRGVDTLMKVVKLLDSSGDKRVNILVAGPLRGKLASEFIKNKRVRYLGKLEPVQALAYYEVSDFVLTYYSPALIINRYAESNKWGDALKMGCAVIVNSEVETSEFLKEIGCAFVFSYEDAQGLAAFLMNVKKEEIQKKKQCALEAAEKYPGFNDFLDRCFNRIGFECDLES